MERPLRMEKVHATAIEESRSFAAAISIFE